ncbi:MFS transporter [Niabella ginsengisoli]|uniref:MFS transporter n=1 Tax=Niabella ginsengisoli TaxID=522298 RepID=A0ABS9SKH5_9BACT|nr:MFS transporter [Niabella ginsengisoli]MCH5598884.1 MFS transporter [Niabella ginsengisoli]
MQSQRLEEVESKPKSNLFGISLIAALAGFIFGFDTVVISGANLPIKELWNTSPWFHGLFIMSMALWGTVIGSIFGGIPTQKYGRKKVLLWIGVLFSVSAIGTAIAQDPYTFSFFRFIGGLGIGVSSVAAPTYISEISTAKTRGRLGAMYQFNIVFGILIAFLSNYFLQGFDGQNDWRWMLGVMAIPSILYTIMVLSIPESPRWILSVKNNRAEAKRIMLRLGVEDPDAYISTILESDNKQDSTPKSSGIFTSRYRVVLWLAFLLLSLINGAGSILFYIMLRKY